MKKKLLALSLCMDDANSLFAQNIGIFQAINS